MATQMTHPTTDHTMTTTTLEDEMDLQVAIDARTPLPAPRYTADDDDDKPAPRNLRKLMLGIPQDERRATAREYMERTGRAIEDCDDLY